MHGGLKVYGGAPAAARHYVEAGRARADDYYLAEGAGIARRFTAGPDGGVRELPPLSGDGYEAWVAGVDPDSGTARGQLRTDAHGVRFVEVVVNGPKSWSLAAVLHPDVAAAYDAAQDRAAAQIVGWLAVHATTRVGPRGGQVQVPVEHLEAVTVAHRTSRAEDPHRHLHLQINARVFAAGKWRGLHTVGVRDSLAAVNGIGHAAMMTDPHFRSALAAHGYVLDGDGEIRQFADVVGPFSARAAQIGRNVDRYEREWTAAHPGETAGPGLRRAWDARAWADGRPDKVTPRPGADLDGRWRAELAALGYREPDRPVGLTSTPVGSVDRDAAADAVVTRLGAARSAWNPADIRGEVEQLVAAAGIVTEPAVRMELAEDVTARAVSRCVPLLGRDGVPEHIRALTSPAVLAVEGELTTRLADRGRLPVLDTGTRTVQPEAAAAPIGGQLAVVAALAGSRPLVVVEGAAGAGKTGTLAATHRVLERTGRRLVVVTPTMKAAKVAAAELGSRAGSAAWLAHQHGWRWTGDSTWARLAVGDTDPVTGTTYTGPTEGAVLRPGDLLVIDEAGMLDQDTARALLAVADEARARVALVGDRHQLPAVGRGGVLDLAVRTVQAADPDGYLTLTEVHRFTRTDPAGRTTPDREYADLTLAMRTGEDPGGVFDALLARGQVLLHPDEPALHEVLAGIAADHLGRGERVALVVDTREQAAELNAAIRDQLVADGRVDDTRVTVTRAGQRIGAGDRITTRRNDAALGVANRDTWTVTAVGPAGGLVIAPAGSASGPVTPARGPVTPTRGAVIAAAGELLLSAGYVAEHVELAYATTAHGVQGDTVTAAHLVIGEHTGAASAYVGMTRGREANTAHLVAADAEEARDQWLAVFARDRADLGPAAAARQAAVEANEYAAGRPFELVRAELWDAWTGERRWARVLDHGERERDILRELIAAEEPHAGELARLEADGNATANAAVQASDRAEGSRLAIDADSDRVSAALLHRWTDERDAARTAAGIVLQGPGRLRLRRGTVDRARRDLADWGDRWRPVLPELPPDPERLARLAAGRYDDRRTLKAAFDTVGRRAADAAHPDHPTLVAAAGAARRAADQARSALAQARARRDERLSRFGPVLFSPDPGEQLRDLERHLAAARQRLTDARKVVATLSAEPAVLAQPADWLATEHAAWHADELERGERRPAAAAVHVREESHRPPARLPRSAGRPITGQSIGR